MSIKKVIVGALILLNAFHAFSPGKRIMILHPGWNWIRRMLIQERL